MCSKLLQPDTHELRTWIPFSGTLAKYNPNLDLSIGGKFASSDPKVLLVFRFEMKSKM